MPDGTANVVETAVLVCLGVYWLGIALYSSSPLALIGLLASAAVLRAIPGTKQRSTAFAAGFAGATLIVAAPILLAVG